MNIIFHHPLPLNPLAASASGIRPLKMLEAFQSLGYNVFCITGYANERRKKFQELKKMLTQGVKFDFLYGESSTMPNALANKNHIPTSPHLDRDIFIFCQKLLLTFFSSFIFAFVFLVWCPNWFEEIFRFLLFFAP